MKPKIFKLRSEVFDPKQYKDPNSHYVHTMVTAPFSATPITSLVGNRVDPFASMPTLRLNDYHSHLKVSADFFTLKDQALLISPHKWYEQSLDFVFPCRVLKCVGDPHEGACLDTDADGDIIEYSRELIDFIETYFLLPAGLVNPLVEEEPDNYLLTKIAAVLSWVYNMQLRPDDLRWRLQLWTIGELYPEYINVQVEIIPDPKIKGLIKPPIHASFSYIFRVPAPYVVFGQVISSSDDNVHIRYHVTENDSINPVDLPF